MPKNKILKERVVKIYNKYKDDPFSIWLRCRVTKINIDIQSIRVVDLFEQDSEKAKKLDSIFER